MSRRIWSEWLGRLLPAAVGLAIGLVCPAGWREAAAAALLGLLGLSLSGAATRLAFALGYALLASAAIARGGEIARVAVVLLSAVMVVSMKRRGPSWPAYLLPAVGLGALGAALLPAATSFLASVPVSRAEGLVRWPVLVVCFTAALLYFSREQVRPTPRALLVLGLVAAFSTGFVRLISARAALTRAEEAPAAEAFEAAADAARRAGWAQGEREARIGQAKAHLGAGEPAKALAALPEMVAIDARSRYARAEAMLALGDQGRGMHELYLGLVAKLAASPTLAAEGMARLGLWESRAGRAESAFERLSRGAEAKEPERYLAEAGALAARLGREAEARGHLEQARARAPQSPFTLCLASQIERSPEAARACLAALPAHEPSLKVLAGAGDQAAGASLAELAALNAIDERFGGAIELAGWRIERTAAKPGEAVGVELVFRVASNLAPGERYAPYVELCGPHFTRQEQAAPEARWVQGELVRMRREVRVPAEAPPGRYQLHVGVYQPESGARLQPASQYGHIKTVRLGYLEVSP